MFGSDRGPMQKYAPKPQLLYRKGPSPLTPLSVAGNHGSIRSNDRVVELEAAASH